MNRPGGVVVGGNAYCVLVPECEAEASIQYRPPTTSCQFIVIVLMVVFSVSESWASEHTR